MAAAEGIDFVMLQYEELAERLFRLFLWDWLTKGINNLGKPSYQRYRSKPCRLADDHSKLKLHYNALGKDIFK